MMASLVNGDDTLPIRISKPMVRAVAIMALQPVVGGSRIDGLNYEVMVHHYNLVEVFLEFPWFMLTYALVFMVIGGLIGFYLQKSLHTFNLKQVLDWAKEVLGQNMKEMSYVEDWDPENHEMRTYRVLSSFDDAASEEEFFMECPNGLARYVKLDRKRRKKYGMVALDPVNAYDLTLSEGGEEEPMEVDDELPAVASVSAAMAEAEVHGGDGRGGPALEPPQPTEVRSDSATREYLSSLPGSPHSEVPELPTVGVDWDDFDVIYEHMPVNQRERAKRVQEVGMFNHQILKEYLQTHLMSLFPGQPDILWDYGAWWNRADGEDSRHS